MTSLDLFIVAGFILLVIAIGLSARSRTETTEEYFLAGRDLPWYQIGFSLFATNFSASAIIGLTGAAYVTGIAIYNYEWIGVLAIVFFALVLVGVVRGSRVYTIAQYLTERYDHRIKTIYSVFTIFLIIFIDMAASLYAGGLLLNEIFPQLSLPAIIFMIMIIVAIYSLVGGLGSISKTDILQTFIIIVGASLIAYFSFSAAGGWQEVKANAPDNFMSLVRPIGDRAVPWPGLMIGIPILGAYFWLTNQNMVQWVLSARSESDARRGLILAGILKLLVLFIIIIPGVAALSFSPGLENADRIYPTLITTLLPAGVLGLVLAGFIGALMSNTDSTLHAASTIITMDFVKAAFPDITSQNLVWVGRLTSVIIIVISAFWAPQIGKFGTLFEYIQGLLSYSVAPFVVVYLGGIFWPRATSAGAIAALAAGIVEAVFLVRFTDWHYLYTPLPIGIVSLIAFIGFSLGGNAPSLRPELTYKGQGLRTDASQITKADWAMALLLLGLIAGQVIWFW